jgi:hypothetical protein
MMSSPLQLRTPRRSKHCGSTRQRYLAPTGMISRPVRAERARPVHSQGWTAGEATSRSQNGGERVGARVLVTGAWGTMRRASAGWSTTDWFETFRRASADSLTSGTCVRMGAPRARRLLILFQGLQTLFLLGTRTRTGYEARCAAGEPLSHCHLLLVPRKNSHALFPELADGGLADHDEVPDTASACSRGEAREGIHVYDGAACTRPGRQHARGGCIPSREVDHCWR